MQLRINSIALANNSVTISSSIKTEFLPTGLPIKYTKTLTITEGFLYGNSQAELSANTLTLEALLRQGNPEIILYRDDGQPSGTFLLRRGAIGGVKVTSGPDFSPVPPSNNDYVNVRRFAFTAEGTYWVSAFPQSLYLSYDERVTVRGGGPRRVALESRRPVPPQIQVVTPLSTCVVEQSGTAVGFRAYPPPGKLLFPRQFMQEEPGEFTQITPKPDGAGFYSEFTVTWKYVYLLPYPVAATPPGKFPKQLGF